MLVFRLSPENVDAFRTKSVKYLEGFFSERRSEHVTIIRLTCSRLTGHMYLLCGIFSLVNVILSKDLDLPNIAV